MTTDLTQMRPHRPETGLVIETHGLTKIYPGGLKAVDGLDLSVREGEIFGLLGPNGAGKTTTVGMLTTRVIPTDGMAVVRDIDVVGQPTIAKQLIGVVSQSNTLDRSVDVWENLYFHGRYFGMSSREARERADESLELFRLTDRAHLDVATLSGGMAQRLMVARAILHRPQVLFLDEPTAGLDPQSRLALWDILRELNDEGQTIFLTTHYMEEAEQLCRRVAIMDHGRLLAVDTPLALKRSIGADTIVTVTSDERLQELAGHIEKMGGVTGVHVVDEHVRVALRGSNGVLPRIVGHVEEGGFHITDLSIAEPTLEAVFIELTGRELRE
jgi:ABC-2 type transport system ATP-binding protein